MIIPEPHFSSCEGINSRRRFDLLLFAVLAQSDGAMTAVDHSCFCRSPAIDRSTVTQLVKPNAVAVLVQVQFFST